MNRTLYLWCHNGLSCFYWRQCLPKVPLKTSYGGLGRMNVSSAGLLLLEQWNSASVKLPVTQPWRAILPATALPSSTWKGMCICAGEYNSSRQYSLGHAGVPFLSCAQAQVKEESDFPSNLILLESKGCARNYEGCCLFSEHPFPSLARPSLNLRIVKTGIASLHYWEAPKSAFIFIFKIYAYCKQFGKQRIKLAIIPHYYSLPPPKKITTYNIFISFLSLFYLFISFDLVHIMEKEPSPRGFVVKVNGSS